MNIFEELCKSLQAGETETVARLTRQAIENKIDAKDILDNGLIAGMTVVGERFKHHKIFLPDVLLAARAMYAGMDLIKPLLIKEGIPLLGKIVIGTVKGDLHDIGKNLVGIMLKGAGYEVIDLGKDVTPEKFVETAEKEKAEVIGLSALLTTTMVGMKEVVELARESGLGDRVKIIIGGAPLSSEYASEIGADAYCFDGINAVETVKRFLEKV